MENCRVQFLNVLTREVLRNELLEKEYAEDIVEGLIHPPSVQLQDETLIIVDSQMKFYHAKYITHTASFEDNIKVYRVMFQVKPHELQYPINR